MRQEVVVIGGGINGLVAANYLQRAGCRVTLLERRPAVGGACAFAFFEKDGERYPFPTGASVLGLMQDFVFRDTGLADRLVLHRPSHPSLVYFGSEPDACLNHDDPAQWEDEARARWGERGRVREFTEELERVRRFLIGGYRDGVPPTWASATEVLGEGTARRWLAGDAQSLFGAYFTSERMKVYQSLPVTESGPVALDSPGSAFTIPLMASGTVLDGAWGFVKGGLWRLVEELAALNEALGVRTLTGREVSRVDPAGRTVVCGAERLSADALVFATDPVTAAMLVGEPARVAGKRFLGTSGKVVLFFREPAVWKGDTGRADFDSAFRFLFAVDTLDAFRRSSADVRDGRKDFSPCSFQVYPEGAAMRKLGWDASYDYLAVFFKDVALGKKGDELPAVKAAVERVVLDRLENAGAFLGSVLLTPRDLQERFFFPEGNIDHMELCEGQTFAARTLSSEPGRSFYRFGAHERVYYCGAGAYPCGSIAGTPGYLCARELLRDPR